MHTIRYVYAKSFRGARERKHQNTIVADNYVISFLIGVLFLLALPYQISDGAAARVATQVMDREMAEAGARMFRMAKLALWNDYSYEFMTIEQNSAAINDCAYQARNAGKAQPCIILVSKAPDQE